MAYTIDGRRTLLSFKQNPKKLRIWELKEHPNKGWGGRLPTTGVSHR